MEKVYNPYESWHKYTDLDNIVELFEQDKPKICGLDTETTGLHIIKDKPFLIIFGWLIPGAKEGRVFTFEPTEDRIKTIFDLAKQCKLFVMHNATYDLSMLMNIGFKYDGNNVVENQVLARLSLEALSARDGGDDLALTSLGAKYVHPLAARSEQQVKLELRELKRLRIQVLSTALKQIDHPTETKEIWVRFDEGKQEWISTTSAYVRNNPTKKTKRVTVPVKWTKKHVEDFLKDITNDVNDLPEDVRNIWLTWQEEYPEPTYADIDRKLMIKYASEDVITMLEFARKAIPVITERKQWDIVKQEMELIPVLLEMERSGFPVDQDYLEESRIKLKDLIKKKRQEMYALAKTVVNIGQHATIAKVFNENWGVEMPATNKKFLNRVINSDAPEDAKKYAKLIIELRRLEKWYSTYIIRIQENSKYDGRLYMQLNQAGAVSGRLSSDGQQFPRDPLYDDEGNIIFHPRRMFVVPEGKIWYFIDFSQIELRSQANYTLLVSGGDLNLCRAYMPFKCVGEVNGIKGEYNYEDPKKRKFWKLKDFWKDENGEFWNPTDVHGQTAHNALLLLGYKCIEQYKHYEYVGEKSEPPFGFKIDENEFKRVRSVGKTFNFMKNYGTGVRNVMDTLNLSEEVAYALVDGYTNAFPGVITYQDTVAEQHRLKGYVTNMYGRRYYLSDIRMSYKLANYLIQGSCADMMKEAMIKIYKYLKENGYKTKMIMTIHDEIIFESVPGEEEVIMKCHEIMQDFDWHKVPIVADIERSETSWVDAKEWSL